MESRLIREKQDLTYLKWAHIRYSGGTTGTFLKSESDIDGVKKYYKLSNYNSANGVVGHECVNELIVDRLLTVMGIEHLSYELVNADIVIDGKKHSTYLCVSEDFRKRGESKIALESYYRMNALKGESHYDFCVRNGWKDYIETMMLVDFLILNRDRHGANIEIIRNSEAHTVGIAPLFDHGLSLMYSCSTDAEADAFDILEDKKCPNYIGSCSCRENLELVKSRKDFKLKVDDKAVIFDGLEDILSKVFIDKIWKMIYERYQIYENL